MEFKAGVVDDYGILSSWGNSSNEEECCNWRGIRCSNHTDHVIVLNLPGNNNFDTFDTWLTGKISPSLSELKHLKYLNLSNNFFAGEIPQQVGNLTNLRSLDLSNNHFGYNQQVGNLTNLSEIPSQLGNLTNLRSLNLSANAFNGEIPSQLGNLTNLRSLDLSNQFGNLKARNLDWVSNLHLLSILDLSNDNLSSCNDWLNRIHKLSSLTHLHLSSCRLPDPSLPLKNTSFSALNSLAVVDLSGNYFSSLKYFNWLSNFTTTLVYLDISDTSLSRIPEAFGRIVSLESLFLSGNELEGMLPDSFRNLSRLAMLDLSSNYLNGSLSEFLHPLATKEMNSLQVLKLDRNQLGGSLPDYFTRFPSLREMSISYNNLSAFPADNFWQFSSTFVHLDLSYNQITGPFPDNYWQHSSSVVHLNLSYNQVTGPFPNLTLFSSLEILDLKNNKLEGTVPESYLSNLSKLTYLDLSSNSLSLNFTFDWLPPFKLDYILLRNCILGPQFPNWIKSQRNIFVLDISHASISDTIPLWFWDLWPRLINLNISNNQIEGLLPNISLAFPDIGSIDFSYNSLQGSVPGLTKYLIYLDLSHNNFTGSLSFICTDPYIALMYLDLSNNKLSGTLSDDHLMCIMNKTQLSTFDLSNNNFSGSIPASIGSADYLSILQLRNNNFTGQLPLSLMNNTNLWFLDLSENKLSGNVPSWTGTHLTGLVILSLRNNEFSGSIPPQICQLGNAQVLDLSQNNLTGSIPHCISKFTSLVEKIDNGYEDLYGFGIGGYGDTGILYPNAVVQWKRVVSEYKKTLEYLKLIDFSGNGLVGEIPEEFGSLKELISLNLSSNRLTGNIIPKIGQMEKLESLDLSRNHLSGEIPSSLASLTFLSVLDLSNNNLTGKIPSSTQLQSFDPSNYAGNEHLCGLPLSNKCGVASLPTGRDDKDENTEEDEDNFPKVWLYVSAVFGFGTGFWGFIGPIMLRRTWRQSYYKKLGDITDWICVTTTLHITRLRRKFYG